MKIPSWYQLRSVGNSPISRLTVLMPFIGYFLIFGTFTSDVFDVAGIYLGIGQEEAKRFNIGSLYWIYFGTLVFSLSTICYAIFCPEIIKIFANQYDFYSREFSVMTRERAEACKRELKAEFNHDIATNFMDEENSDTSSPIEEKNSERLERFRQTSVRFSRDHWLNKFSGPVFDLLHQKYFLYDISREKMRLFIFLMYCLATLMIAVPTLRIAYIILANLLNDVGASLLGVN